VLYCLQQINDDDDDDMPKDIGRKPRTFLEVILWKATEFRQFLLYSGSVSLQDEIKSDIYHNFMLLSVSMQVLHSPSDGDWYWTTATVSE